jgi:LPXTG-motif cell wall-anchored protein
VGLVELWGVANGHIAAQCLYGNKNAYATGCADPHGVLGVRVSAAEASQAPALTGSNNTHSFVLIGVAALVVGLVLTVGARRRNKVTASPHLLAPLRSPDVASG